MLLLFKNHWSALFSNSIRNTTAAYQLRGVIAGTGLNLVKVALFILNLGLVFNIMAPEKMEDERVEKIRNYAIKQTFIITIACGLMVGLIVKINPDLLLITMVMLLYYFLLLKLCLSRDSAIVYMTPEEIKVQVAKTQRLFWLRSLILGSLGGGFSTLALLYYPSLHWLALVILIGAATMAGSVSSHWKQ